MRVRRRWEARHALRDPALKPTKLPELDARGNEIWRPLLRIADLAGERWSETTRAAAHELSGGDRRREASTRIQLLADVCRVFSDEKLSCRGVVDALNALEEAPWGAWNEGSGITTRELGRKLAPLGILARTIRIGDWRGNGYERAQLQDPRARYLPAGNNSKRDSATTRVEAGETAEGNRDNDGSATVSQNGSKPHGERDVPVVTVFQDADEVERLAELAREAIAEYGRPAP